MNPAATRSEWRELRDQLEAETARADACPAAAVGLSRRYDRLDRESRHVVDELLREWVRADDEALRADALAVIWDHAIASAMPELDLLLSDLSHCATPGARFQRQRILRTIGHLETAAALVHS